MIEPMLAKSFTGSQRVGGWHAQHKLDGVRGVLSPEGFFFRSGKPIYAPEDWLHKNTPADMVLDGELVLRSHITDPKPNDFQKLVSVVRRKEPSEEMWSEIMFAIFDSSPLPFTGNTVDWQWRRKQTELTPLGPNCVLLPSLATISLANPAKHVGILFDAAIEAGYEGIMLRDPKEFWLPGQRSAGLLKVKPSYDCEARVLGVISGTGKHEGRMGALLCELANGTQFKVGTGFTDAQRESADEYIGELIVVNYQELTAAGKPRHPAFKGIRDERDL